MQKKQHIPEKPFTFLIYASQPHLLWALGAFSAATVAVILSDTLPFFFKQIIDTANTTVQSGSGDFSETGLWVYGLIIAISVMYIGWRLSVFLGMRWVTGISATGQQRLFEYLSQHSHTYFSGRFAGALSNKVFHAADGSEKLGDATLWNYYTTTIGFIVTGILVFSANLFVGFIYVLLIGVLLTVNIFLVKKRHPLIIDHANKHSVLRGVGVDIISNISAVQQFARRMFEMSIVKKHINARRMADIKQWQHGEIGITINNVIIVIGVGAMFVATFHFLQQGTVTIGDFVMVMTLMFGMLNTLTFIGNMLNHLIRVYGEVEEGLNEILKPHDITDFPKAKDLAVSDGNIKFNQVGFSYGTRRVFKDFSVEFQPGERIGVVGPSGSGKTTFVSLLLRQYDVHEGEITIDGQNIRKVTQESLRSAISVVPQEPLLFHRSIRDNIGYGKEHATEEDIIEAAKQAQAHEFILETPEGYDTLVGERGVKLSGGQRQRIAIARAILKSAPILVLDEATSSLDSESEVAIQKALEELMKGKTVIAIAHRLSTIRAMDRIIVLERGEIVQDGTHDELVKEKTGTYARLWNHQAGGFLQDDDDE